MSLQHFGGNEGYQDLSASHNIPYYVEESQVPDHTDEGLTSSDAHITEWRESNEVEHIRGGPSGEHKGTSPHLEARESYLHETNDVFSCAECGEIFQDFNKLIKHATDENHKAFRCLREGCEQCFSSLESWKDHTDEHDAGPRVKCPFCSSEVREYHIDNHLTDVHRVATGNCPAGSDTYHCRHEDCAAFSAYYFLTELAYLEHLRSRHRELLFICNYPGCRRTGRNGFVYKSDLLTHHTIHISATNRFLESKVEFVKPMAILLSKLLWLRTCRKARKEKPPANIRRIYWHCAGCATELFDDYYELQQGSLDKLEARLNSYTASRASTKQALESFSSMQVYYNGGTNMEVGASTVITGCIQNSFSPGMASAGCTPSGESQATGNESYDNRKDILSTDEKIYVAQDRALQPTKLAYLLCCFPQGKYGSYLHQERLDKISTDRSLFEFLRDFSYERQFLGHLFTPLKTISGLRMAKFLLTRSNFVDVKSHEHVCTTDTCVCIPPPDRIEPNPKGEYHCHPVPPPFTPPVGENYLMHSFMNPACVDPRQTWVYSQIPKRTCGRLVGTFDGAAEGWGLCFSDGWNWSAIWSILLVFFVLPSFVFLVVWAASKHDVQGASGIAAYWIAVGTIILGFLSTRGE